MTSDVESEPSAGRGAGATRWIGPLRVVTAVVLLVALGALLAGPGRGLRADIARQRHLLEAQLATTRQQLDLTTKQLDLTTKQLEVTTEQLAIARMQLETAQHQEGIASEQLAIAREQLSLARQQLARTQESLDEQRRLRAIAEATLRQATELNGKIPDLNPAK